MNTYTYSSKAWSYGNQSSFAAASHLHEGSEFSFSEKGGFDKQMILQDVNDFNNQVDFFFF